MIDPKQFGGLMEQAQQHLQNFERMRRELEDLQIRGQAGGGWVTVIIDGKRRIRKIAIAAEAMSDKAMLEDLIAAAVNDALANLESAIRDKMGGMLPGPLASLL